MSEVTKLSEIPFGDLKVGDRLVSAIGNTGKITRLVPETRNGPRWDTVDIEWTSGKRSQVFHMNADAIEYFG